MSRKINTEKLENLSKEEIDEISQELIPSEVKDHKNPLYEDERKDNLLDELMYRKYRKGKLRYNKRKK